ncbi:MAG: GSU3529 family protein [Desulfuromonadaceae bacterium]
MNVFTELEKAVNEQFEHGDLPKWLADPVLEVAYSPHLYEDNEYLLELLLEQVQEYDVYAEAGCCKWAYDHWDIQRTLKWLKEGK